MNMKTIFLTYLIVITLPSAVFAQNKSAQNPLIFADVPDMSMIRVGKNYYMSSTTMHMSPVNIVGAMRTLNFHTLSLLTVFCPVSFFLSLFFSSFSFFFSLFSHDSFDTC